MIKNTNPLAWINRKDQEQIQWVNQYLGRHLALSHLLWDTSSVMMIAINNAPLPLTAEIILLINKMRSAWRQKQFRSKQNGKKTYSFVMSINIEKQLKSLAGNKGEVRETLERLINERFMGETPIIMELKNKNKELQAKVIQIATENLTIKEVNHALNQASRDKNDELSKLKTELKKLKQDKANLLNELKQLKEKHNNQFREKNPDIYNSKEQAHQTP